MREVKADLCVAPAWRGWVREVLQQVRFWPDHQAIQKELTAHLEDARADFVRLGYPRDLAAERALQVMGDAGEVGRALDRAHQPWLGWLWQASRALAVLALALAVWMTVGYGGWPDVRQWGRQGDILTEIGEQSEVRLDCPEPFRAGAYTIAVDWAVYDRGPEANELTVALTAATPRFWLDGPALTECLEAEDSNGVRYTEEGRHFIQGGCANSGHIRNVFWIQVWRIENAPAWIDIRHKTAGWSFRLELPQGEEETP